MSPAPLLLYGILSAPGCAPRAAAGVGGAALRLLGAAPLQALTSELPDAQRLHQPQVADLLTFHGAIAALHQTQDVLPARFGVVLSDEAALRAHLEQERTRYQDGLRRIAGCVEMGVRLTCAAAPPVSPPFPVANPVGGAGYLRSRQAHYGLVAAQEQEAAQAAARVQERLQALSREARALPLRREDAALVAAVAFLVPRASVAAFQARFHEGGAGLASDASRRLTLVGPWPPFSFTPEPAAP